MRGWPQGITVPKEFNIDEDHWDSNFKYKMTLPKKIINTPWTKKNKLEDLNILQIALFQVLHAGVDSYGLRLLANGRYAQFEVMKSYKESCLTQALLEQLRLRDPNNSAFALIDVDAIAANVAKQEKVSFATPAEKNMSTRTLPSR